MKQVERQNKLNVKPVTRVLSQPVPCQNNPRIVILLHYSCLSCLKDFPLINSLTVWGFTVFCRQAWNSKQLKQDGFPQAGLQEKVDRLAQFKALFSRNPRIEQSKNG